MTRSPIVLLSRCLVIALCGLCCWDACVADERSQAIPLTTDGRIKNCPVFIDAEGQELVFVLEERPTQWRLMKLKLDDRTTTPLSPNQTRSELDPAWSPASKHLAFVQSRGNLSLALVIRDMATSNEAEVPPAGGFAGPRSPAFSADGRRVLFSFATDGRQRIDSVDLTGGNRRTIIESNGVDIWPDCAPDGKRLVWSSSRDDDYEIYTAAMDGADVRRLTDSPRQDLRPRYSPDGKRIAFTSNRDGNYEIYVMEVDGSNPQRITNHPERDDYAVWHPLGDRLVIVAERNGRSDLQLIPAP